MDRAVIISGGNLSITAGVKKIIRKNDYIISADSGADLAARWGFVPDIVIGDMDSIGTAEMEKLKKGKTIFLKHPEEKNKTDFELALDLALEKGFRDILVLGIMGDRIDHLTANLLLAASVRRNNPFLNIRITEGNQQIFFLVDTVRIKASIGDVISIIPLDEKAGGITTFGLKYKLKNSRLKLGTTRGISNVAINTNVRINQKDGFSMVVYSSLR